MKVLNVFAIIIAWILSIAMVLMLMVAPLTLSALSLLNPENIVQIVGEMLATELEPSAAKPQEEVALQNLSVDIQGAIDMIPEVEEALGDIDADDIDLDAVDPGDVDLDDLKPGDINLDNIQEIVGDSQVLGKIVSSPAVSKLVGAYTTDVTNALAGKTAEKKFTAELLVEVVQENVDEIVDVVTESTPSVTGEQKEEIKEMIKTGVEDKAEEIMEMIPSPEMVKESILQDNAELGVVFEILAMRNQIKTAIVGMIVLLAVLIFALRFPGLRGMRWLATNLFTAGAFNLAVSVILGAGSSVIMAILGIADGMNAIGGGVDGVIGILIAQLAKGMVIRTVVIFVAAIALLVGYYLLKPFVRKKKVAVAAPVTEEFVPQPVPAFVPTPVEVETEQQEDAVQEETVPAEEMQ